MGGAPCLIRKALLDLPLPHVAVNNPIDLKWIYVQQNTGAELATRATK